jgi:hypothetical protein
VRTTSPLFNVVDASISYVVPVGNTVDFSMCHRPVPNTDRVFICQRTWYDYNIPRCTSYVKRVDVVGTQRGNGFSWGMI